MGTELAQAIANSPLARAIARPLSALRRVAPDEVDALKATFPDFADVVDESRGDGIKLGGGPPNAQFVAKTWAKALRAAELEFSKRLPKIKRRLDRGDQVELASEVVAAVSGSAMLGLLFGSAEGAGTVLRIAAASLTLAGTLSALVARYLRRGPGGGSIVESYIRLTQLAAEAQTLQIELTLWAASDTGEPTSKGDELSARASRVLTEMNSLLPNSS